MILTKEVFSALSACPAGYETAIRTGNIGKEYDEVIAYCFSNNLEDFGNWLKNQKNTEVYVKMNGKVLTMGAYQLFNPMTGQHTRYETKEEAEAAMIILAKQILDTYCPSVVQELSNENGDTTWTATDLNKNLIISI